MSCNCKSSVETQKVFDNKPLGVKISHYVLKTLAFLIMVALLPVINLFIIYFMFKTIVLNKEVDVKPMLVSLGRKFKQMADEEDDEEEDDYNNLTSDDVEMLEVEDITEKKVLNDVKYYKNKNNT